MKQSLLTIAGLDPSGGAGLLADTKVFESFGFSGAAVATALTVQNSTGVFAVNGVEAKIVGGQLAKLFEDLTFAGAKLGMLSNEQIVCQVAALLKAFPQKLLVLDPVLISSSGKRLLSEAGQAAMITELLPLCDLITPNLAEAEALTGIAITGEAHLREAGEKLLTLGPKAALIKGGHSQGPPTDWLFVGGDAIAISGDRYNGPSPHGTGCHLSSSILALLAQGNPMETAAREAKKWLFTKIKTAQKQGSGSPYLSI